MYVCMYACVYVCMYVCVSVYMYVCVCMCIVLCVQMRSGVRYLVHAQWYVVAACMSFMRPCRLGCSAVITMVGIFILTHRKPSSKGQPTTSTDHIKLDEEESESAPSPMAPSYSHTLSPPTVPVRRESLLRSTCPQQWQSWVFECHVSATASVTSRTL